MLWTTGKNTNKKNAHFKGFNGLPFLSSCNLSYFIRVESNQIFVQYVSLCETTESICSFITSILNWPCFFFFFKYHYYYYFFCVWMFLVACIKTCSDYFQFRSRDLLEYFLDDIEGKHSVCLTCIHASPSTLKGPPECLSNIKCQCR